MKKVIATVSLGTLLVAGFLFSQEPAELASDLEPSVFSISHDSSLF
ncbi:hypothetical protein [Virgibacillus salinus]|uniref:Uncharacterized protein n=1 Tax=Virgibacillus salinus TaxID=553311 RepID=A0A1H1GD89_9BACI|nr:hypothetical protein [Virgibacillus salinus]SDR11262.1 hypothetical protein SAMN05216231_3659 [Virgibacillus salinus]